MNSAHHAVLALSLDPESQARINRLAPQGFARQPAIAGLGPAARQAERRFTWADACSCGELKSRCELICRLWPSTVWAGSAGPP